MRIGIKKWFISLFRVDLERYHKGMPYTVRVTRLWVQVMGALLAVAAVGVIVLYMLFAKIEIDAKQEALRAETVHEMRSQIVADGWMMIGDPTLGSDTIEARVIFGDCRLRVTAPRYQPDDLTIEIPTKENSVVRRSLADTSYTDLKRNRYNYALEGCFFQPLSGSGT